MIDVANYNEIEYLFQYQVLVRFKITAEIIVEVEFVDIRISCDLYKTP